MVQQDINISESRAFRLASTFEFRILLISSAPFLLFLPMAVHLDRA